MAGLQLHCSGLVQVEYQFSDTNLVANDFLTKIMNKDPEGYGEWRTVIISSILYVNILAHR